MKKLFFFGVPLSVCNLRCHYCYLTTRASQYEGVIPKMEYTPDQIAYAMRKDRVGGESYFNICADGETLLLPHLEDYVDLLAKEGHWIEIVTNMVANKGLNHVLSLSPASLSQIEFKCSLHYLQLKERNLLDTFAENINHAHEAGASINVEITPSDELIPFIDEVKEYSITNFGALPQLTIARDDSSPSIKRLTKLSLEEYNEIWSSFDSNFWQYKTTIFGKKQTGFCNAGSWSYYVNMATGEARQCYCGRLVGNLFSNPDKPLPNKPIGKCPLPHCYNGHVLLTLGDIANATPIRYGDIRDRECVDGSHWLQPQLKSAFNTKLQESNTLPSSMEQRLAILETDTYEIAKHLKSGLSGSHNR